MLSIVIAFAAVSLVVFAVQVSCFFSYQEGKKEADAPTNGCVEY